MAQKKAEKRVESFNLKHKLFVHFCKKTEIGFFRVSRGDSNDT